MFTNIRSAWGFAGVVLFLIALYLLLNNSKGATSLANSFFSGSTKFARTLQGR